VSPTTLQLSMPDDLTAEVATAIARGEYELEGDAVPGQSRRGRLLVRNLVPNSRR
jgi:hypothetical protein